MDTTGGNWLGDTISAISGFVPKPYSYIMAATGVFINNAPPLDSKQVSKANHIVHGYYIKY